MARPRLDPRHRRDRQINIRVTAAEARLLAEYAEAERLTVAAYLRRRGLRRRPPPRRVLAVDPELRQELNRIGWNLNQAVRLAHQGRYRYGRDAGEIAELERIMERIETILDPGDEA